MKNLKEVIQKLHDTGGSRLLLPQNMSIELFAEIGHIINRIYDRTTTLEDRETFLLLVKLLLSKKVVTKGETIAVVQTFHKHALTLVQSGVDAEKN